MRKKSAQGALTLPVRMIFGASSHIFLQLYNCTALAAIVVDLVLGGDTNMKSTGSTSQEIEPVFVASLLSKVVTNRFFQA